MTIFGVALTPYREAFSASSAGMELLINIPDALSGDIKALYLGKCPTSAADDVSLFLINMLNRIDQASVVERILEIDQDYLGIYEPSPRAGAIGLHWGLIALCAPKLNVSMEALALKVLTHEYAHAFSHLGMDANGNHWDMDAFLRADRFVLEGLANYFSWCVLKSSDDWWMKEALRALEAIWPRQPPPYREFDAWRVSIGASQEDVRNALRIARENSGVRRTSFKNCLSADSTYIRAVAEYAAQNTKHFARRLRTECAVPGTQTFRSRSKVPSS